MKCLFLAIALAATGAVAGIAAVPKSENLEKRDGPGIVRAAESVKGTPYRQGGGDCRGATKGGFDCAGLTQFCVCKAQGKTIPRTAQIQYSSKMGRHIPRGQAVPGDMVFWATGGNCSSNVVHVGIVVRPGVMINAESPGTDVREKAIRTSVGGVSLCPDAVRYW